MEIIKNLNFTYGLAFDKLIIQNKTGYICKNHMIMAYNWVYLDKIANLICTFRSCTGQIVQRQEGTPQVKCMEPFPESRGKGKEAE